MSNNKGIVHRKKQKVCACGNNYLGGSNMTLIHNYISECKGKEYCEACGRYLLKGGEDNEQEGKE